MNLGKSFFERETLITAKVICDSVSEQGVRLTTFEIEYPRFIHGELMTHRMLSKNSSSSRAIPIQKMLEQIESNMAIPIYWGKNKSGMQAVEEVDDLSKNNAEIMWKGCFWKAKDTVSWLSDDGLHKQVSNRLTEPFQMMKVVITGTDWDNFFNLRIHPDAQPEICMLAYKMYEAMSKSVLVLLKKGDYHLPYVNRGIGINSDGENLSWFEGLYVGEYPKVGIPNWLSLEQAIKYSVASCASVSYRATDMTLEKAEKIWNMLVKSEVVHASPLTHVATPISKEIEIENSDYQTIGFINRIGNPSTWEEGVTHMRRDGTLCSGRFAGWIQQRHLIENNTCWSFNFEDRMKSFE